MKILDQIPFDIDEEAVFAHMHMASDGQYADQINGVIRHAIEHGRPKAVFRIEYVEDRTDDSVAFGGVRFTSSILRSNLDEVERVFPYIVTCGREFDEFEQGDDMIAQYCLDRVKEMALGAARRYLREYLDDQFSPGKLSSMNPGSGPSELWPIEQQKELFTLFDGVEDLIGVHLTDSCLMIPNKTVSGIFFPTEFGFEACRLCAREKCPSRHVPYDGLLPLCGKSSG